MREAGNYLRLPRCNGPIASYFALGDAPFVRRRIRPLTTLEFGLILEGEITLVLDTEEVALKAGDTVVQRGTNHAWSNRSDRPCVIAFSAHDGAD